MILSYIKIYCKVVISLERGEKLYGIIRDMVDLNNLSVLIVTWKGDGLLKICLDSLCAIYGNSLEIVVVDNANQESTRKIVSRFQNAKYLCTESNLGFAGGNNLGFVECSRKYVLLLNNDTVVHEDSFGPLVDFMESHNKVGVTQGRMRLPLCDNTLDDSGVMFTKSGLLFHRYTRMSSLTTKVPTRIVHSVKGAMMMIRKDVVRDLDDILFYPHFHCNYEETDFCHRVWLAGWEVYYVDTPAIDHLMGQTMKRFNKISVSGQAFSNQLFSLLTTLEKVNVIGFVLRAVSLQFVLSLYQICTGSSEGFKVLFWGIKSLWCRRHELYRTRKVIQKKRRISDKELFKKVMVKPGIKYYYHFYKGDLPRYWDSRK